MYANFYGFRENPFSLLPDPDILFLGPQHEHVLSLLQLAIINRSGFCAISGPPGTGKTTLIRALLTRLDSNICAGLITDTHASFSELLERTLNAFELDCPEKDDASRYKCFTDFVIRQYAANRNVLLIVDEAQNLSAGAMEQLRMLSNINADKHMMIQIMLIGQESLQEKLRSPALEQLAQRIEVHHRLAPLDAGDTSAYIQYRIDKVGGPSRLFDDDACKLIYARSGGVPRVINRICDLTLVCGYAAGTQEINAEMVKTASREPLAHEPLPQSTTQEAVADALQADQLQSGTLTIDVDTPTEEPVADVARTEANDDVEAKREAMTKASKQKAAAVALLKEKLAATQTAIEQAESLSTAAQRAETEARMAMEKQADAEYAAAKLITAEKLLAAELADSLAKAARCEADNAAAMNAAALRMAEKKEALARAAAEQAVKAKEEADKAAVAEMRILMDDTSLAPVVPRISQQELATVTRLAAQARARKKRKSNGSLLAASVTGVGLISWMTLEIAQPTTPIDTATASMHAETATLEFRPAAIPPKVLIAVPAELAVPITAFRATEPETRDATRLVTDVPPEKPLAKPIRQAKNKPKTKKVPKHSTSARLASPEKNRPAKKAPTGTVEERRARVARLLAAQREAISAYEEDSELFSEN